MPPKKSGPVNRSDAVGVAPGDQTTLSMRVAAADLLKLKKLALNEDTTAAAMIRAAIKAMNGGWRP